MNPITLIAILTILGLAFVQNISFSIVSRSRNRNNMKYHLIAAFFSNTIWFLTFRALIKGDMNFVLFMPYCVGTMCGSLCGVKISMFIEKLLGAAADGHLGNQQERFKWMFKTVNELASKHLEPKSDGPTTEDLVAYLEEMNRHQYSSYLPPIKKWLETKRHICPACQKHPIAAGRDTCVDCSH